MLTNIVITIFIIFGLVLILAEIIFSISLINHSSTIGFFICLSGTLLLSIKTIKNSKRVERKYYEQFPADASGYSPGNKKHDSDVTDLNFSGNDFSSGGGGDSS